ncbi:Phosphoglycerate dehydrogenase [Carnobacterium iners]|uniref:Phosphoglycerate dehydrogenase n=1 Tax=Carnobacterium iners TaxID=1073423 RepID=A0A1X7N3R8_9LACT|nr:phosphoglycerate dehydrogenase [Carnobacterium iners]SEK96953.1 Phosphoglycerate dehydrogenase [Carnobacterium iners]SMH31340.1 Phosphoglycerate dehydrogenase [Carnobacterium iners]
MIKKGIWLAYETTKEQMDRIKQLAPNYELIKGWDKKEELDFPLENIEIIYGWKGQRSKELLANQKNDLKWIQGQAAGVDFLDLEGLKKKNVVLTNGSGIHSIPIAESVFGMLLTYTRGIQEAIRNQQKSTWNQTESLIELHGKTIMIVGTGKIGKEIGRMAKAFNMKTIGINSTGHPVDYMDEMYDQKELIRQVSKADIVVNILPLTKKTSRFFDDELFDSFKYKTLFLNVGRGPSVDVPSLIRALNNGKVAFAGLDVFEQEPLEKDSPLWVRDDVLITPHISGIAEGFKKRLFVLFEENLKAYMQNKLLPVNVVDYEKKY